MPDLHAGAWQALRRRLTGRLILPGEPDWDTARRPAMERFAGVAPLAIVQCAQAADVPAALEFTVRNGLPTVIRSGGHDFAGRSVSTGVVLDTSGIRHVAVLGDTATVGAGVTLGHLYRALNRHARTIPAGSGETVGIAGLTLGGGLGVLGRHYGLTCDSLLSAQVVLADGHIVTCDDRRDADLFWGLRGAGAGHFGVVTELEFGTVPAPRCTVFELTWGGDEAARVLAAWQSWAPDAPPEMAASLLLNASADPGRPLRVTLFGAIHDAEAGLARNLLNEFAAAAGNPATAWQRTAPWLAALELLTGRAPGTDTGWSYSKSEFHERPLPPDAIDELVTSMISDRIPGESRELDFSPWAGAYNAAAVDATAYPHRRARFLLKHAATLVTRGSGTLPPVQHRPPSGWLIRSWQIAHNHGTGGVYPNFPDPDLSDPALAYFGPNLDRLRTVKRTYDPRGILAPL